MASRSACLGLLVHEILTWLHRQVWEEMKCVLGFLYHRSVFLYALACRNTTTALSRRSLTKARRKADVHPAR